MKTSNYYGSRSNPGMDRRGYKGKSPRHDVSPRGKSAGGDGTPHPNGGNVRAVPTDGGMMPKRVKGKQVTHTPLSVPKGNDPMPKRMGGMTHLEPSVR